MIEAGLILGAIGAVAALGLGAASVKFHVETDPKVDAIDDLLPGANCGACGYTGCRPLAEAIATGDALPNDCIPGGEAVADAVGKLMGISTKVAERNVAVVHCKGTTEKAPDKGVYVGVEDCRAATLVLGSPKGCAYGCMGMSTCVNACPFDAIFINEGGIAEVDFEECTGCGKCVKACPKSIISLAPASLNVHVRCNSPQPGKKVKAVCKVGCIGCTKCVKVCPVDALEMKEGLSVMDIEKCVSCGLCAEVCPTDNIDDKFAPRKIVTIEGESCIGCTKCVKVCPTDAITGEKKAPHVIDEEKCVGCYRCQTVCPKESVVLGKVRGQDG